jgi:hypothetical protein
VQGVGRPRSDEQLVRQQQQQQQQQQQRYRLAPSCALVLLVLTATLRNRWRNRDRTAYISDVLYGTPSYEAQMNSVDHNFIIANYGASQGFDTDDGSSWYDM